MTSAESEQGADDGDVHGRVAHAGGAGSSSIDGEAAAAVAFEDFYRREFSAALRLAWSLTGRRAVAEEVCQEAFLAAYRRWPKVAAYEAPELWLRRVLLNRCVSVFRRATTEARYLRRRAGGPAGEHLDPDLPDEELWAAVRALPRRQAQVVALVYVGDLSVPRAADAMGCSVDTARTHLRRALSSLERRVTESGSAVAPGRDGEPPTRRDLAATRSHARSGEVTTVRPDPPGEGVGGRDAREVRPPETGSPQSLMGAAAAEVGRPGATEALPGRERPVSEQVAGDDRRPRSRRTGEDRGAGDGS